MIYSGISGAEANAKYNLSANRDVRAARTLGPVADSCCCLELPPACPAPSGSAHPEEPDAPTSIAQGLRRQHEHGVDEAGVVRRRVEEIHTPVVLGAERRAIHRLLAPRADKDDRSPDGEARALGVPSLCLPQTDPKLT